MANTITKDGYFLTLSSIDADWLWSTQWPQYATGGVPLYSISFVPAAATDKCVIESGSVSGPVIFSVDLKSAPTEINWEGMYTKYYGGGLVKPVLDASDGSYNAAALVIFQLAAGPV